MISHNIGKRKRTQQIVCIIFNRFSRGLSDRLVTGKMNHRINLLGVKQSIQCLAVTYVNLVELRSFSGDCLDPVHHKFL